MGFDLLTICSVCGVTKRHTGPDLAGRRHRATMRGWRHDGAADEIDRVWWCWECWECWGEKVKAKAKQQRAVLRVHSDQELAREDDGRGEAGD